MTKSTAPPFNHSQGSIMGPVFSGSECVFQRGAIVVSRTPENWQNGSKFIREIYVTMLQGAILAGVVRLNVCSTKGGKYKWAL